MHERFILFIPLFAQIDMKPQTRASAAPESAAPKAQSTLPVKAVRSAPKVAPASALSPKQAIKPAPQAARRLAVQPTRKPSPTAVAAPVRKVVAKVAAKPTTKPTAKPAVAGKPTGPVHPATEVLVAAPVGGKQKPKLVRDSFTIPKDEYGVLLGLKQRAGTLAHHAKKSEILRAGVQLLSALPDARFLAALVAVPSLKTGRPKQELAVPAVQGSKKQGR